MREIVDTEKAIFLKSSSTPLRRWEGKPPQQWLAGVGYSSATLLAMMLTAPTRSGLYELWADQTVAVEDCAWITLAWGGMRTDHGRMLKASGIEWIAVCKQIQEGDVSRSETYELFAKLKKANKLRGMGPAYFTKLIHFARRNTKGYILDQWTARSVHVLTDQDKWPRTSITAGRDPNSDAQALRVRVHDKVSAALPSVFSNEKPRYQSHIGGCWLPKSDKAFGGLDLKFRHPRSAEIWKS